MTNLLKGHEDFIVSHTREVSEEKGYEKPNNNGE